MTPITLSVAVAPNARASVNVSNAVGIDTAVNVRAVPVTDYGSLSNKPKINGVELSGNKRFEDLGEQTITNTEIAQILESQYKIVFGG